MKSKKSANKTFHLIAFCAVALRSTLLQATGELGDSARIRKSNIGSLWRALWSRWRHLKQCHSNFAKTRQNRQRFGKQDERN